jgi:hypothetical protein
MKNPLCCLSPLRTYSCIGGCTPWPMRDRPPGIISHLHNGSPSNPAATTRRLGQSQRFPHAHVLVLAVIECKPAAEVIRFPWGQVADLQRHGGCITPWGPSSRGRCTARNLFATAQKGSSGHAATFAVNSVDDSGSVPRPTFVGFIPHRIKNFAQS